MKNTLYATRHQGGDILGSYEDLRCMEPSQCPVHPRHNDYCTASKCERLHFHIFPWKTAVDTSWHALTKTHTMNLEMMNLEMMIYHPWVIGEHTLWTAQPTLKSGMQSNIGSSRLLGRGGITSWNQSPTVGGFPTVQQLPPQMGMGQNPAQST